MEASNDDQLRKNVSNFLGDFQELIYERKWIITDRVKNREALIDLGLTERQREEIILSLTPENYIAGPKPDEYREGIFYWEFGSLIDTKEVYIKLEILTHPRGETACCLSFHRAERPLSFHFKP